MLQFSSALLIDDKKEDLKKLRNAFFSAGLPCLTIFYDKNAPEPENNGINHFNKPEGLEIRIVFSDLNLEDLLSPTYQQLVSPIANVLTHLQSSEPYFLILWSNHASLVDAVMKELPIKHPNCPLPLHFGCIDKAVSQDQENLKTEINNIIKEDNFFNALLEWERSVAKSALGTIKKIYDIARTGNTRDPEIIKENMQKIVTKICHEAIGYEHAKINPHIAIREGLFPVLYDSLSNITESEYEKGLWCKALPELSNKIKIDTFSPSLNSFFHIEASRDIDMLTQGAFIRILKKSLKLGKFKKLALGLSKSFINVSKKFTGKSKEESQAHFKENIVMGLLEISPDCDHAQKNIVINKFVAGALIPEDCYKLLNQFGKKNTPNIYEFPELLYKNKKFKLILNFRFQFGTLDLSFLCKKPEFRVREQILKDIIFKTAQYSSRPGIISFC